MKLNGPQSAALMLLRNHEKSIGHDLEAGDAGTYTETWYDRFTVGIHWQTAAALQRRGLVTIDGSSATHGEPSDVFLTDLGRRFADG